MKTVSRVIEDIVNNPNVLFSFKREDLFFFYMLHFYSLSMKCKIFYMQDMI